jgi:hypothetical protein
VAGLVGGALLGGGVVAAKKLTHEPLPEDPASKKEG